MKGFILPYFLLVAVSGAILLQLSPANAALGFGSDCGNNKTHNFQFGKRTFNDWLLYVNHTVTPSKFLTKTEVDVQFPPKGQSPRGVITFIDIKDQFNDGTGGCAILKNGGIGYSNALIHLSSQRGNGMNFIINVYGQK